MACISSSYHYDRAVFRIVELLHCENPEDSKALAANYSSKARGDQRGATVYNVCLQLLRNDLALCVEQLSDRQNFESGPKFGGIEAKRYLSCTCDFVVNRRCEEEAAPEAADLLLLKKDLLRLTIVMRWC
jgi:hypothetical protein